MPHLSEDPSVGGGDPFDGPVGIIDVEVGIAADLTFQIRILGSDLAVLLQLFQHFRGSDEPALSVGYGDGEYIAGFHACQPGRFHGSDPGLYQGGYVAADGVVGQGRAVWLLVADLAVGHQSQFDQCLETVADPQHQPIPVFQQVGNGLQHFRVPEDGGDEFRRTLRFVPTAESAGDHDHLTVFDFFRHPVDGFFQLSGGQVPQDVEVGLGAGLFKGPLGIHFAVGSREDRDENAGLCCLHQRPRGISFFVLDLRRRLAVVFRSCGGEYGLQRSLPHLIQFVQRIVDRHRAHHIKPQVEADGRFLRGASDEEALPQPFRILYQGIQVPVSRDLQDQRAVVLVHQQVPGHAGEVRADEVPHGHFGDGGEEAALADGLGREDVAFPDQFLNEFQVVSQLFEVDDAVFVFACLDQEQLAAGLFEFRRKDIPCVRRCDSEGDQGRRYVPVHEGTGHGVFPADGGDPQLFLGFDGAQESRQRLAPPLGVVPEFFKVFLEGQPDLLVIAAHGGDLRRGVYHCVQSTVIGAVGRQFRIEAEGHQRRRVGVSFRDRKLGSHPQSRGQLPLPAQRHQYRAGSDGGVEHFRQALLAAAVQVRQRVLDPFLVGFCLEHGQVCRDRHPNVSVGALLDAVGIQEFPGQVEDHVSPPVHLDPSGVGDLRYDDGFQVFLPGHIDEFRCIFCRHDHGHSFLGFGDGQFRAVQTVVFLQDRIQFDVQAVRQFTDGHGNAAGTKVVAAFDQLGRFLSPEEPLKISFHRRVALLDFRSGGHDGIFRVFLGGTGGTAAAVPAGPSAG